MHDVLIFLVMMTDLMFIGKPLVPWPHRSLRLYRMWGCRWLRGHRP
jgi:hypothetical protein